jgi:NAD(P)-dependent dehydrogenase (short-subunit alcohol dehydrogenase family)
MMQKNDLYLVTGASSGIGEAIARSLHATGARVLMTGRNEMRLERIRAELKDSLTLTCDLKNPDDVEKLALFTEARISEHGERLKGLVNNAGIFVREAFDTTELSVWQQQFETNLFAPIRLTKRLAELLKSANPSSVLNIASTLGLHPVACTNAYSSTKAAMVSWTKTLALEWAASAVRVNCLCPGLVDTPIHSFHGMPDELENRRIAHAAQPLGRLGRPEDIAQAAIFLLSEKSSWTTGAVWTVDGGIHLL